MRESLPVPRNLDGIVWHFLAQHGEPNRPAHTHKELEMNLCVRGRATYLYGSRQLTLHRSSTIWFFPDDVHTLVEWSRDFEMWVAVFRPCTVREIARQTGDLRLTKRRVPEDSLRVLSDETTTFLASLARDLHRDVTAVANATAIINTGLRFFLARAWDAFVTEGRNARTRIVHPAVERAVLALTEASTESDIDSLPRICGLSRARLSHQFKLDMGIPLSTYRNRKRIERFQQIFGDGRRMTVLAAALEAGFGSASQFYRVYRDSTGNNPSFTHLRCQG